MSSGYLFLTVIGTTVVVVTLCFYVGSWVAAWLRRRALRRLAAEMGFRYRKAAPILRLYAGSRLHRSAAAAKNVLVGRFDGGRVVCFDCHGMDGMHERDFSVCAVHTDYRFEPLLVTPGAANSIWGKPITRLLQPEITLDLAAFSNAFRIECGDKKAAYDIMNQRAMELMLQRPSLTLDMAVNYFLIYGEAHRAVLPARQLADLISHAKAFAAILPTYLERMPKKGRQARPAD